MRFCYTSHVHWPSAHGISIIWQTLYYSCLQRMVTFLWGRLLSLIFPLLFQRHDRLCMKLMKDLKKIVCLLRHSNHEHMASRSDAISIRPQSIIITSNYRLPYFYEAFCCNFHNSSTENKKSFWHSKIWKNETVMGTAIFGELMALWPPT